MGSKPSDPRPTIPSVSAESPPESSAPAEASPARSDPAAPQKKENVHPDPTRYGDWERKGRCIDF